MRTLALLCSGVLLAACPGEPPPAAPPAGATPVDPATPAPAPQSDGRLPALAIPTHYALELEIDPEQPRFKGTTRIDVDIPQKTSFVVLHGRAIEIAKARLETPS